MSEPIQALLFADSPPDERQQQRFREFLYEKYGREVPLVFFHERAMAGGFRLEVGDDIYDFSAMGRFDQLRRRLLELVPGEDDAIPLLRETMHQWTPKALAQQIGHVLTVGDGIATVSGLPDAFFGEILLFEHGIRGMIQSLTEHAIGCMLFDSEREVPEGSRVYRTGRVAGMPVGEAFLGRTVDALGNPIDGKGPIKAAGYRKLEQPAPGIIDRSPVTRPLQTGILAVDAMFPIGRGQRELIIGDRQTGKTAIALDAILNQKGKNTVCIYVAIGQKSSSVAQLVATLEKYGALSYTAVVAATAADSAPLQYAAPYAGCTLGEYFMERGRDVLIVYDDLSKHAVAYRSISLLLGHFPGREAYPGDIFYLHARLLERAAQLSPEKGGGSMTALPIVETQEGDVTAYIPTNIISITDGQLFLESELFFAGQRPALNIGLSVSRVGKNAQTPAMKEAVGTLRLDLAQYRELRVFTKFSGDLDESTRHHLEFGEELMNLLRQPRYRTLELHREVALLHVAMAKLFVGVRADRMGDTADRLLTELESRLPELCGTIDRTGTLDAQGISDILREAKKFLSTQGDS